MERNKLFLIGCLGLGMFLTSCSDDNDNASTDSTPTTNVDDFAYVGKAVGNFSADEWYPGGELGTTTNVTGGCYEDPAPAVDAQGLSNSFNSGEYFFERTYTVSTRPFYGLGPAAVRSSCLDCHPGYGHGKRQDSYTATWGNGYLLVVYHPTDGANSNDGPYISEVTGMPQTMATTPFLPPIDESGIHITWNTVTNMESGLSMTFPDGETYSLIYPTITIDSEAFNTDPVPTNLAFRLESTIGVIGTGLIDAIPADSIKAEYQRQYASHVAAGRNPEEYMNTSYWDISSNDFASGAMYSLAAGTMADGTTVEAGLKMPKRFTYAMTRASLQDGPGANAIWNITNVTRGDRHYLYTTDAWAKAMSQNEDVIEYIIEKGASESSLLHPYYGDGSKDSVSYLVNLLLGANTAAESAIYEKYFVEPYGEEMYSSDYYDFLVWHRGLAIPRARDLNDASVQRGKELFYEMGCTSCHRPMWTTTDDNYWAPSIIAGKALPRYRDQKIFPYSDFIHHKLDMINDIHGSWCRTTPLWGRGLSLTNTGAQDRLHDCRARNEIEAIMWHGYSKDSQAYHQAEKFYNLSKSDRDAVVKFLKSI